MLSPQRNFAPRLQPQQPMYQPSQVRQAYPPTQYRQPVQQPRSQIIYPQSSPYQQYPGFPCYAPQAPQVSAQVPRFFNQPYVVYLFSSIFQQHPQPQPQPQPYPQFPQYTQYPQYPQFPQQNIYGQFNPYLQSPQRRVQQSIPQSQLPPQAKILGQPQVQPKQSQPEKQEKNRNQQDDDLEKRFEQALEKTNKIVQEAEPQDADQPPETQNIKTEQSEDQQELEDLALQYEDGFIYRGQGYPPQTRNGFGILTDSNENEVYSGFWKDNFYHGEGKLTNLDQELKEGRVDWQDMTSIGNAWSSYEGEFQNGKMHGSGTLSLTNGEKYQGQFNDGMVHGEGVFSSVDDQNISGVWDQGQLVKLNQ